MPKKRRYTKKTPIKRTYAKKSTGYNMMTSNLFKPMKSPKVNRQFTCVLPYTDQLTLDWKSGQDTDLGITFSLDKTTQHPDFQDIFDFYRIDAVYIKITPRYYTQQVNTQLQQLGQIGNYAYCIDRDDNAQSSYNEIRGKTGSRYCQIVKPRSVAFTPNRVNIIENDNQLTTGRTIDTNYYNFIDLRQPRIPHFGFKIANNGSQIPAGTGLDGEYALNIDIRMKITFRGVGV